jgi:hypothetical protein
MSSGPPTITVFHGTKSWSPGSIIRAPSIEYLIARGLTLADAIAHARSQLLLLNDFVNRSILERAMLQAQTSGIFSPFVSTSRSRNVARSFVLGKGLPGFILKIEGPEDAFYDFNKIRDTYDIPPPTEFEWLEELGVPLQIESPLAIVEVDELTGVVERKKRVYKMRKARKK